MHVPVKRCKHLFSACAAMLVLAGCPKRFDPRADPVKGSPNSEAEQQYRTARAQLDGGDARGAAVRFAEFITRYPDDPLIPSAKLGQARALMQLGESGKAKEVLEPMTGGQGNEIAAERARYLLGLTSHRLGDAKRARELLLPFSGQVPAGDEATELEAVLADACRKLGETERALDHYDRFYRGARPSEQRYIRDRVDELVRALPAAEAQRLYGQVSHSTVGAAFLAERLAADRRQAGDEAGARNVLDETRDVRRRVGLEVVASKEEPVAAARAVGCLLPLTGRSKAMGERALRGILLAAGTFDARRGIEVRVRDTGSDPARAAQALESLVREGVLAVIGSPERSEGAQVMTRGVQLGVPVLGLAPDDVERGRGAFKLVQPRTRAAQVLAEHAVSTGARAVAVLAPDNAYGRSLAQAFVDTAKARGARIVADLRYAESATTFIDPAKRLKALAPDVVFVPAPAQQLALVASQLVASQVIAMPGVVATGKVARLYATADGVNERFMQSSSKYVQGAVLAPVFYSGWQQREVASFVEQYRMSYTDEPSSLEALAFDAVRAVRAIADDDPHVSRDHVLHSLGQLAQPGVTGELGFAPSGERRGAPKLYLVEADTLRPL
jgi:branched-chain amino acid transport system substrate-binding protein